MNWMETVEPLAQKSLILVTAKHNTEFEDVGTTVKVVAFSETAGGAVLAVEGKILIVTGASMGTGSGRKLMTEVPFRGITTSNCSASSSGRTATVATGSNRPDKRPGNGDEAMTVYRPGRPYARVTEADVAAGVMVTVAGLMEKARGILG